MLHFFLLAIDLSMFHPDKAVGAYHQTTNEEVNTEVCCLSRECSDRRSVLGRVSVFFSFRP